MDEQQNIPQRPINPRRRPRSKMRIFKETYLPVIILGAALILILVLIFGAIFGGSDDTNAPAETKTHESEPVNQEQLLQQEAAEIMYRAESYAEILDYDNAIRTLQSFTGDLSDPQFADMAALYDQLVLERSQLVPWNDPGEVMHLCVQLLIADPDRAFNDDSFSDSFRKNFLTTEEFAKILPQLYENGYILVSLEDIISSVDNGSGTQYEAKTLYLPQGKKPLLLTQTNVNYPNYLIDSDYDNTPDAGGSGFASKLVYDESGEIACEYVDADGNTLVGAYDMIPILDQFVAEHPDFSYRGAKATIALTGYEGLFGYRTDPALESTMGTAAYEQQLDLIRQIADDLKSSGYELACFCYNDKAYSNLSIDEVNADLNAWTSEIVPILGGLSTFVFAREGDIAQPNVSYMGDKFQALTQNGFQIFMGYCTEDGKPWFMTGDGYVRFGRVMLTPANLVNHPDWFEGIIDGTLVLDPARGNISG